MDFFSKLLDTSDFPERWNCGQWSEFHGWLHIISDLAVFAAYTAIPLVVIYFASRRQDIKFPSVFWLFCGFIFACGTVHLIEATIFWWPIYRVSAVFKFMTAVVSWASVFALIRVIPKALRWPTIETLNLQLKAETNALREAQSKLELALAEVQNAKKLTDAIIGSIGAGVVASGSDGKILLSNRAASQIVGLSILSSHPGSWSQSKGVFHEDETTIYQADELPLARAAKGEKIDTLEMLIRSPEFSSPRWVRVSATPVLDGEQRPLGGVVVFDDITEVREARVRLKEIHVETKSELAKANLQLDRVLNTIPDVIWSGEAVDASLRFLYFSPAIIRISGRNPVDLIDDFQNYVQAIHVEDRERMFAVISEFLKGDDESITSEYRIVHLDGSTHWIRNRVRRVEENGIRSFHGIISDITKERKTEAALVQAERLISIGTLAAGIAHEINNPLGAMMLSTELVITRIKAGNASDDQSVETLKQVMSQIERCSRIASNVLQFAQNESSKKIPYSMVDIAEKSLKLIFYKANRKQVTIKITKNRENDVEPIATINPTEMEQVVVNLLANAVDAAPIGSEIELTIKLEDQHIIVAVHDDGSGMDEETKKQAFDPFFTTRREWGGTGMGLSMCHTIIAEHGGLISITDSSLKKGANVNFRIPRNPSTS